MTQKQANRLVTLIEFLKPLERKKFDFQIIRDKDTEHLDSATGELTCGTSACAIGWTPEVFPKEVEFRYVDGACIFDGFQFRIKGERWPNRRNNGIEPLARKLFGTDRIHVFCPGTQAKLGDGKYHYTPRGNATPKQVAKWLTKVLGTYGYTIQ